MIVWGLEIFVVISVAFIKYLSVMLAEREF